MRSHSLLSLGVAILTAGCNTVPARAPVLPEPPRVLESAECAALGRFETSMPLVNHSYYGWALLRYDVERGVITRAEIVDSSPKGVFDADTIAFVKSHSYPSLGTAHGCLWHHKWG